MTATCRDSCCSVTPRKSVSELFERGFRRLREAPLSIEGAIHGDHAGNFVRFSLDVADGRIASVGFQSSSCATLIAYCELIAESVPGSRCDIARALTPQEIIETLPGVPPYKHDRAVLAVAALRAALNVIPT